MKYPQSVEMPRQVQDWLENELEARGIDGVVYTRHILNLLQQDSMDYSPFDWPHISNTEKVWSGQQMDGENWDTWYQQEDLKRLAVIECLMSASGQKGDAESLVDELCSKLDDFQSCTANEGSTDSFPTEFKPFASFEAFPPLLGSVLGGQMNTLCASPTWTRGILRASLDQSPPYLRNENLAGPVDCFSQPYFRQTVMDDHLAEQSFAKGPLYERSSGCNIDRVIGRIDSTIKNSWNPFPSNVEHSSFPLNNPYFFSDAKLFSPALFAFRNANEPPPITQWSLGGNATNDSFAGQSKQGEAEEEIPECKEKVTKNQPAEEDLLVSARTHFRPIKADEVSMPVDYADGTTFPISPNLEQLEFHRSESGTLFLETAKYMEYKVGNDGDGREFIPKFRVSHSNEKFCQTEDFSTLTDLDNEVYLSDSPDPSISPESDLFFPSDFDLSNDLENDISPAEEEVAQIVSGKLKAGYRAYVVPSPPPEPEFPETAQMNLNDVSLIDLLNNGHGDEDMEDNEDEANKNATAYWPTDKIWNPDNHVDTCDYCEPVNNGIESQAAANPLIKGIWGCRVCRDCKDKIAAQLALETAEILKQKRTGQLPKESVLMKPVPSPKNDSNEIYSRKPSWVSPIDAAFITKAAKDAWTEKDVEAFPDWGPIVNKDMSVFLEVERVAALKSLSAWSPVNQTGVDYLLRKNLGSSLRNLWSPTTFDGKERNIEDPVWVSVQADKVPVQSCQEKPVMNSLMRDELTEDGDQLLTHLRFLHLQQQESKVSVDASDMLEEDSFPTEPPSPQWGKGRIVNMWAYWNIKTMGNYLNDERHNSESTQKERKRRHSSSHRPCELSFEGECRRRRCRFIHGDVGHGSPLYAPYISQRAFTM